MVQNIQSTQTIPQSIPQTTLQTTIQTVLLGLLILLIILLVFQYVKKERCVVCGGNSSYEKDLDLSRLGINERFFVEKPRRCIEESVEKTEKYAKPQYPNDRKYMYSINDEDYENMKKMNNDEYEPVPELGTNKYDADSLGVYYTSSMNRDKRKMDAANSKTADYYKYHFAEELDEAEDRVWWGKYDV